MNKIRTLLAILLLAPVFGMAQTSTENYVKTETMLDANGTSSIKSVQYYNGLGYPTVGVATVGGDGETAATLTTYDGLGREYLKYVPVPGNSLDCLSEGTVKNRAYNTYHDNSGFIQNHYDALGRVTAVDIAGDAWADKQDRTVYLANTSSDRVLHYEAPADGSCRLLNPENTSFQYYPANSLSKVVTYDADNKSVTVFSDLFGKKILERTAAGDTYYVYNDLGQLRFVLPPAYNEISRSRELYAYEYRYDERGRVEQKFLPGAEYIKYWYDRADRVVGMQDGVMRKKGLYRFTLYDRFGRVVVQGLSDRFCIPDETVIVADYVGNGEFHDTGYNLSYDPVSGASPGKVKIETVNYYDSYDFLEGGKADSFVDVDDTTDVSQVGCLTGSLVLCSNGEYLSQVMEYDLKGNLLKTWSREIGGREVTSTSTYTFTNNVASSEYDVEVKSEDHLSVKENFTYNGYNNKKESSTLSIEHGDVSNASRMTYTYDELGRLESVSRPSSSVSYAYDLHGWLKGITTNSFTEELFYADCPDTKYNCYNGNIGTMRWSNSSYEQVCGYKFVYDGANRLTDALYGEQERLDDKTGRYNESLEYDENGNITRIMRQGPKLNGQYGVTDDLRLSYTGNQLTSVEEDAQDYDYEGSFDFKAWKGNDYSYKSTYDENGSLLSDEGRKIAYIRYDSGNNPEAVYFTDGHITKYVYSATGQKLRVIHLTAKSNVKRYEAGIEPSEDLTPEQTQFCDTTDYLLGGRLVLKKGRLDRFLFDGGYCSEYIPSGRRLQRPRDPSLWEAWAFAMTRHLDFYYYNQDHLGNVREVVDDKGKVQQATNYYPFGVPYTDVSVETSPDFQPYKFNGKELDKMYGLNTYDYGARQYNPVTGRWDRIDPLAEKFYPYSPYVYCMDNPVKYIDPDGRRVVNGKGINVFYINSSNVLCVSKYASSNERMVFNGMMLTSTGQKMLRQMIKSKTSIRLKFKARCADAVGRVTYAETQQWGTGNDLGIIKDKNGKFRLKYATIIFYMETIKESLEKENNDNYGLTLTEAMGAEATHESVHASDEEEVDKDIASSNGGEYRSIDDSERKPNQMEQQFRNELKQKKENDE